MPDLPRAAEIRPPPATPAEVPAAAPLPPGTPTAVRPALGLLLLVITAALWSLNGPLIKLLDQAGVPGVSIAASRSLLGGLLFLPLAWSHRASLNRVRRGWPVASVLIFTLMTVSFVVATTLTAASSAIILQYTSPVWVFLLGYLLLHERFGRRELLAAGAALAGVALIYAGSPRGDALGLLLALVSGFGYGTLTVLLRGMRPVNPLVTTALNTLGSGLLLAPLALWKGQFTVTTHTAALLLITAFVQFSLPYLLFAWALRHIPANRAALVLLLEPILNAIWTYLAVGEQPPRATFGGGPLILLAAAIVITARAPRAPAAGAPASSPASA